LPRLFQKSDNLALFEVHRSRRLLFLLLFLHSSALIAGLSNSLAWFYKLFICIAVVISLWRCLQREWFNFQSYSLCCKKTDWFINFAQGDSQPLQILPTTVVTTQVIVLHYKKKKKHQVLIFKDSLTTADYRTLQVLLKITYSVNRTK